MISQNILTIDISNIDFNSAKFRMVGSLTLDKVKIKYNWIFNAQIKDAIIGEDDNGLVWYSGTWINGVWEDGTWYSGTFLDGRWKGGNVYSYDIDTKQLLNGNFYIIKTDISKTHFVRCNFEGGNFNYGIFGSVNITNGTEIPYKVDGDFIINNIVDYQIDSGFNYGAKIGFSQPNNESNPYTIKTILLDSENRIIVGGRFSNYNGVKTSGILRLNYDGSINDSFYGGINENGIINKIIIDSNNRILLGGDFTTYNKKKCNSIIRIFNDGTIDEDFNLTLNNSDSINYINDIYIDSLGKIYLGGNFYFMRKISDTEQYHFTNLIKLNDDGSIDLTFGSIISEDNIIHGIYFDDDVNVIKEMLIDSGYKIMVAGKFSIMGKPYDIETHKIVYEYDKVIRLNLDGTKEDSYLYGCASSTFSETTSINTIEVDSDNRIFIGGDISYYSYTGETYGVATTNGLLRLNKNGFVDSGSEFRINSGFKNTADQSKMIVNSIKIDSQNRIVVGGYFNKYNTNLTYNIARIDKNGNVDETFEVGTGTYNNNINNNSIDGSVNIVYIDPNNKIYFGGKFNIYNQNDINLLVRVNNGIIDDTNNKKFIDTELNRSIFKGGNFINGLFNSAIFENGNFKNGFFNNSIWYNGLWYNGLFVDGEWFSGDFLGGIFSNGNWYNGTFSKIDNNIETYFGMNYKNKKSSATNWFNGTFSNGKFYSMYHKLLDETEKLNHNTDILNINNNELVTWYNGYFNNGVFYGGTIHYAIWTNGTMYDGLIKNILFNNGYIIDTICEKGIFKGGYISGGLYQSVTFDGVEVGYELN